MRETVASIAAIKTGSVLNLTFHGIGEPRRTLDPGEASVWIRMEQFHQILDRVSGCRNVRITFDDGNASDFETAAPALADRGLHGTFFIVAGRLNLPEFVGATQVKALHDMGMSIGSHGMHHRPWRGMALRDLTSEAEDSRRRLEDAVGAPVFEASCPFGGYDRRVIRALRSAGYARVYTSDRGWASPHDFLQTRNTLHGGCPLREFDDAYRRPTMPERLIGRARITLKRWR